MTADQWIRVHKLREILEDIKMKKKLRHEIMRAVLGELEGEAMVMAHIRQGMRLKREGLFIT